MGSLSQYTTREAGLISWAIWWRFGAVGMPVPMSRNWSTPSPASHAVARFMNARFWWAPIFASMGSCSATAWSTG